LGSTREQNASHNNASPQVSSYLETCRDRYAVPSWLHLEASVIDVRRKAMFFSRDEFTRLFVGHPRKLARITPSGCGVPRLRDGRPGPMVQT
jgi:hypothetical protein